MAAFEAARETFVEHGEFRTMAVGSGIPWPIRGDLAREGGVAGEDQYGRAIHGVVVAFFISWAFWRSRGAKLEFPAPKGASDFERLAVIAKAIP